MSTRGGWSTIQLKHTLERSCVFYKALITVLVENSERSYSPPSSADKNHPTSTELWQTAVSGRWQVRNADYFEKVTQAKPSPQTKWHWWIFFSFIPLWNSHLPNRRILFDESKENRNKNKTILFSVSIIRTLTMGRAWKVRYKRDWGTVAATATKR